MVTSPSPRRIVVGVTGGIAAYKTVQLVRLLVTDGHDVHVVPTENALRFVGAPTWEAISRNPVTTSVHDDVPRVRHVALGQAADLVVIAPATAHTLAKMAAGLADDLLGTTLLATTAPVVVAPAMHTEMWRHPATQANVATLRERGVRVVGPDSGRLTGDDSGPGRMSEPEHIHAEVSALLRGEAAAEQDRASAGSDRGSHPAPAPDSADLAGLRIVVSAGGTREPIDPVRFLGNRSSGRQGVAIARAAADRGAEVVLVAAHVDDAVLAEAPAIDVRRAGTAAELGAAMRDAAAGADVVIMAAAVADYRVAEVADVKLTKESSPGGLELRLVENDDILAGLAASRAPGQTIVGFAAETVSSDDELVERARRKRERKGVDLLAANAVGWDSGFESHENAVVVVDARGEVVARADGTKREVANALLDAVVRDHRERLRPGATPSR
ncbi:bifunctional phosphopantothenoylcysteine decarboxylase/phosphopantothenate synthase [Microbacterium sediminis]|uniref:Coenzyme A biosynthesis bifunctional protein CoaBC n=1 Tax=Microbacterium sediminis TaxID=904291 RepID=A0A1B9N7X7_9MICO|nr:bifunctional phosphopantothenoylcysteine decarboxylase/phosphopantothenate synthase [Microbacterium sediminis]OCG72712.1 phosphopantothenoylcysteine decarboxylase [Microbacterium sediminis]QBR74774.1 bifunctional phosphopantothenoylcysteine decarboxylase/phosphopantothenate synthase [Microbacterium sediminis]